MRENQQILSIGILIASFTVAILGYIQSSWAPLGSKSVLGLTRIGIAMVGVAIIGFGLGIFNEINRIQQAQRTSEILKKQTEKIDEIANAVLEASAETPATAVKKSLVELSDELKLVASVSRGSNFSESNFEGSRFTASRLNFSDFAMSNFTNSNFPLSQFRDADFFNSRFGGANFTLAFFGGADFTKADFRGVDLSKIILDEKTILPSVK